MSGTNLYDASVPLFRKGMVTLKGLLQKAISHYGDKASEIPNATLIGDMKPLSLHVQLCSNIAKKSLFRLGGITSDVWEDNEDTAEKLIQRCDKTIELLDSVKPEQLNGREDEAAGFKAGDHLDLSFSARDSLFDFSIPFFYFHAGITYSILRKEGVSLGVADFLGPYIQPHMKQ